MDNNSFAIVCVNAAHPIKTYACWFLKDDKDNTLLFATREQAECFCLTEISDEKPFMCGIVDISDIDLSF